jgi:transposase
VVLEALKAERTASELACRFGVRPTMLYQRKRALLEGASGVVERSGAKEVREIDEGQVKEFRAKIGELAVAVDFLAGALELWGET